MHLTVLFSRAQTDQVQGGGLRQRHHALGVRKRPLRRRGRHQQQVTMNHLHEQGQKTSLLGGLGQGCKPLPAPL